MSDFILNHEITGPMRLSLSWENPPGDWDDRPLLKIDGEDTDVSSYQTGGEAMSRSPDLGSTHTYQVGKTDGENTVWSDIITVTMPDRFGPNPDWRFRDEGRLGFMQHGRWFEDDNWNIGDLYNEGNYVDEVVTGEGVEYIPSTPGTTEALDISNVKIDGSVTTDYTISDGKIIFDTEPTGEVRADWRWESHIDEKVFWPSFYFEYEGQWIGFRIRVPDGTPPANGWPIMIWGGANSGGRISEAGRGTYPDMSWQVLNSPFWWPSTWFRNFSNTIMLTLEVVDREEWETPLHQSNHPQSVIHKSGHWGTWAKALRQLLGGLIHKTANLYSDSTLSEIKNFNFPEVDPDRIYAGGWSGGAFSAFGVAYELRDMLAGILSYGGQPMGDAYADHWTEGHHYNEFLVRATKDWAKALAHIPIFMGVGVESGMVYSCDAFASAMAEVCSEEGIPNLCYLRRIEDTGHDDREAGFTNYNLNLDENIKTIPADYGIEHEGDHDRVSTWLWAQTRNEPYDFDLPHLTLENLPYEWIPNIDFPDKRNIIHYEKPILFNDEKQPKKIEFVDGSFIIELDDTIVAPIGEFVEYEQGRVFARDDKTLEFWKPKQFLLY